MRAYITYPTSLSRQVTISTLSHTSHRSKLCRHRPATEDWR